MRDGRSFASRSVKAVQDGRAIFIMQASFHVRDDEVEHSDVMRAVPDPDSIVVDPERMTDTRRKLMEEWSDWDIRYVDPDQFEHNKYTASQQVVWFRSSKHSRMMKPSISAPWLICRI